VTRGCSSTCGAVECELVREAPTRPTREGRITCWCGSAQCPPQIFYDDTVCKRAVGGLADARVSELTLDLGALNDPAIEMVRRRARIRDLRAQITGLETDLSRASTVQRQ
jgi:hypothetical protein